MPTVSTRETGHRSTPPSRVPEQLLRLLLRSLLLLATMSAPPRAGEALPIMYRLDPRFMTFALQGQTSF